jgi:hypothetical protein
MGQSEGMVAKPSLIGIVPDDLLRARALMVPDSLWAELQERT